MTDADAFPLPLCGRHDPLDAQSGNLDTGAFPQHARTRGARHRRLRVRADADDREQGFQDAQPEAAGSLPPVAAASLIPSPEIYPQAKENRHDLSVLVSEP